jgi:hypothetical protein
VAYSVQATSVWQWYNHAEALATSRGKVLLRINLDETSVCLHPGGCKGAVFVTKKWLRAGGCQNVPKWKRRRYMSHIGIICDRVDIQAILPQFVIGNRRTFLLGDVAALRVGRPLNVRLVRRKSAWSNSRLTATLVGHIAAALGGPGVLAENTQVVLLLDAAKIHYTPEVLRACKAANLWLIVIPPRMTFLLQPLDTDIFALYKCCLQAEYQCARSRSAAADGDLCMAEFLPCIDVAIQSVLEGRTWATAFDRDGFGAGQRELGGRVRQRLQLSADVDVSSLRPSDEQLQHCFPRRARPDLALLWSLFDEAVAAPPPPPVVAHPADADLVPMHGVDLARGPYRVWSHPGVLLPARRRRRVEAAEHAASRLSPGVVGMPPLLRRYRTPRDLD